MSSNGIQSTLLALEFKYKTLLEIAKRAPNMIRLRNCRTARRAECSEKCVAHK